MIICENLKVENLPRVYTHLLRYMGECQKDLLKKLIDNPKGILFEDLRSPKGNKTSYLRSDRTISGCLTQLYRLGCLNRNTWVKTCLPHHKKLYKLSKNVCPKIVQDIIDSKNIKMFHKKFKNIIILGYEVQNDSRS